jgi:hypothetical protein
MRMGGWNAAERYRAESYLRGVGESPHAMGQGGTYSPIMLQWALERCACFERPTTRRLFADVIILVNGRQIVEHAPQFGEWDGIAVEDVSGFLKDFAGVTPTPKSFIPATGFEFDEVKALAGPKT